MIDLFALARFDNQGVVIGVLNYSAEPRRMILPLRQLFDTTYIFEDDAQDCSLAVYPIDGVCTGRVCELPSSMTVKQLYVQGLSVDMPAKSALIVQISQDGGDAVYNTKKLIIEIDQSNKVSEAHYARFAAAVIEIFFKPDSVADSNKKLPQRVVLKFSGYDFQSVFLVQDYAGDIVAGLLLDGHYIAMIQLIMLIQQV